MKNQKNKKKLIFLGDLDSINIELIIKSFDFLKHKVKYILICNKYDFLKSIHFKKSNLLINEILDPINFYNYKINQINIFNIELTPQNFSDLAIKCYMKFKKKFYSGKCYKCIKSRYIKNHGF